MAKKYCLTDCAKKRLNTFGKIIIELITGTILVVGSVLLISVVIAGIGYVLAMINNHFELSLFEKIPVTYYDFLGVGLGAVLLTFLVVGLGIILFNIFNYIYKFVKAIVTNKLQRTKSDMFFYEEPVCKIFEECENG
jgi:hypothetical protein